MSNIRVHKEVNLTPIHMKKESLINIFYGLVEQYNKQNKYEDLIITKQELWNLSGFKGEYNSLYVYDLIKELTKSDTYNISNLNSKIKEISGSMFIITTYKDERIKIEVPRSYQELLFYKKDIDLMYKAKYQKVLSIAELDHYDNYTKEKSKFLVLLRKADILGIKGKYNKRLYSLLMQFKKTGLYFTTWDRFKEILEIPKSYTASHIQQKIFAPAKKELLKVGIEIIEIKKIKKGRSIDRVEIRFKCEDVSSTLNSQTSTELIQEDKEENKGAEMSMIKRKALAGLVKKGKYHLIENLMNLKTDEEIEELIKDRKE